MARDRLFTVSPWEERVGYCRAIRAGDLVFVAGTTSVDPETGALQHPGAMGPQAERTFANIVRAVERLGGTAADIVRVTMYLTDMDRFEEVAPVHRRFFGDHPPAATAVQVARLAHPDLVFEAEATAVLPPSAQRRD